MFLIFGDKGTGAFSAEAALAEAGADYRFETVPLNKNEHCEIFREINPTGKVPALKLPSGEIVTESAAILLTVADRFPDSGLLPPPGSATRAQCYRWIAFLASEIYPMVEITDYPRRFAADGEAAKALKAAAQERIRKRLLTLEENIGGPWLLASGFSVGDIYAAMFTRWRDSVGEDWAVERHTPKLLALAGAISERPRIAPVWRRHFGK